MRFLPDGGNSWLNCKKHLHQPNIHGQQLGSSIDYLLLTKRLCKQQVYLPAARAVVMGKNLMRRIISVWGLRSSLEHSRSCLSRWLNQIISWWQPPLCNQTQSLLSTSKARMSLCWKNSYQNNVISLRCYRCEFDKRWITARLLSLQRQAHLLLISRTSWNDSRVLTANETHIKAYLLLQQSVLRLKLKSK